MHKIRKQLHRIADKFNVMNRSSRKPSMEKALLSTEEFEREFEDVRQLAKENYEKFLKTSARLEDYKKRTATEDAGVLKYGSEGLMREILPFIDTLEKAVQHGNSEQDRDPQALIKGIQLAIEDVKNLPEKYGLKSEDGLNGEVDAGLQRDRDRTHGSSALIVNNGERTSNMDSYPEFRGMGESVKTETRNAIIAVGGAKGGVGKTIFAANLAIALANLGKSVVAVDLDLGGSNLHLYMGHKKIQRSLNDFLCNKEWTLSSVVVPTDVKNLSLLGGNNSLLGAANLHFDQKLKLIRALKALESDIVILDLGGDTSFNVLDFYLQADLAIVVSSTEPTSYLDAYNFIKLGLLRRLSRHNGPEYRNGYRLSHAVESLLREAADWQGERPFTTVVKLLDEVQEVDPEAREKLQEALVNYQPYLIFNMVREEKQSQLVYERIQEIGQKMLGISINQLGPIPDDQRVRRSVRTLKPLLTLDQDSSAAKAITGVSRQLVQILAQGRNTADTSS